MRSERRAEQQGLFQISVQAAPVMAAMKTPLNLKALYEDLLESFDKGDPQKVFR
jgi:hypothetical protein